MVDVMFAPEEVTNTVKDIVEAILQQDEYDVNRVSKWQEMIVEDVMRKLASQKKPFKYMITASIMQKSGAGLHVACSANCDQADGISMTRVDARSMICIVVVIGSSLSGL
ncbi:Tctex-1_family protein [Hexamita inflata]|uniref:Tctex-1 family protein n=1 Tax=Hexamita inflata TaxID=28002 RepID=A0AA86V6I7_9EUKA|nr:Tctex-1 family protein [Hexamita inflata]CAI9978207.1 Tctex-1 family protein [Hexamita inflata]